MKTVEEQLNDAAELYRRSLDEIRDHQRVIKRLRQENDYLNDMTAIADHILAYCAQVPDWVMVHHHSGTRGGPVTVLSDVHYGEVVSPDQINGVNKYNTEIAARRLRDYANRVVELCENHLGRPGYKWPGLVLCLGGDFISGSLHEELRQSDERTPIESVHEMTNLLYGVIDYLAGYFGDIFVPCVVGNHGRTTFKSHFKNRVSQNYDWLMYLNLAEKCKTTHPRVKFLIGKGADATFAVYGHRFFFTHGDNIGVKGGDGIIGNLGPIARGAIKIANSEAQIGRNVDTAIFCHYHTYLTLPNVIVNGSVKGYDEFAHLAVRAKYERPTQALFLVHPEYGRTITAPVYLEKQQTVLDNQVWVQYGVPAE